MSRPTHLKTYGFRIGRTHDFMLSRLVANRNSAPETPAVDRSTMVREAIVHLYRAEFGTDELPASETEHDHGTV